MDLEALNEELIYKDGSFQFLHCKGQSSPHQSSSYQSSSNKKINIATLRVAETADETKVTPSKIGLGFDSPHSYLKSLHKLAPLKDAMDLKTVQDEEIDPFGLVDENAAMAPNNERLE